LLDRYQILLDFYRKLFPVIVIDEFQDTNYLSWCFVKRLINADTKLFLVGDPLQRIYGFIGAVPNLINKAVCELEMNQIKLEKNYRFKDNANMLVLDKNIRANALNCLSPAISGNAYVNLHLSDSHEHECDWLSESVNQILSANQDERIAVLVQQRGVGINMIMDALEQRNIEYFYALFSDDDEQYVEYHYKALDLFKDQVVNSRYHRVTRNLLKKTLIQISRYYQSSASKVVASLIDLTESFFKKIIDEYSFLNDDEKYNFVCDTFENRALKQNMDAIDCRVFVSTVHGAKGLEWENVFIPDMEPYCFPNFYSLCGNCDFNYGRRATSDTCKINIKYHDVDEFLEELSVFYVAVTRARKQLFFSASKSRYNNDGARKTSRVSCLLYLPGISPVRY
jgi:DNA helicase-2/ATP-dependent DNA helicase PcrA